MTAARLQVCMGVLSITSVPDCGFGSPLLVKEISPIESARKNEETVDRRFLISLLLALWWENSGIYS